MIDLYAFGKAIENLEELAFACVIFANQDIDFGVIVPFKMIKDTKIV